MGCCKVTKVDYPLDLEMPDQELAIFQTERQHPFASVRAEDLVQVFGRNLSIGKLTDQEFRTGCSLLEIPLDSFFNDGSPYTDYLSRLKSASGIIHVKKLLTSGVLLSCSSWDSKLQAILVIFNLSVKVISQVELVLIFQELIHVSVNILSLMTTLPKNYINFYINKIGRRTPNLCDRMLKDIGEHMFIKPNQLIEIFRKKRKLQKFFWPNGIRLMLVEEDIKLEFSQHRSRSDLGTILSVTDARTKDPHSFRSESSLIGSDHSISRTCSTTKVLPFTMNRSQIGPHELAVPISQLRSSF